MDLFDDEPSERTIRAVNRNAVREAFERDEALAKTTATTTTTTTTSMEKAASKSTDGDSVAVSRRVDDKYTIDDKRQPSSSEYPWMSASSQHFHPSMRTVPDSFALPAFNGTNMDADTWLAHFRRYAEYRQLADRDITQIFPLFLKDSAIDWYDTLSADLKTDLESLLGNFKSYFGKTELDYVFADETVFTRVQRPNEKARDYISQMQKLAKRVPHLQDEILHWVILRGLRPWIKASIIAQKGDLKSVADILECAKVAESAGLGKDDGSSDGTKINQLMQEVRAGREEVQQLTAKMAKMSISVAQPRSPTPERRQQRVSFQDQADAPRRYSAAQPYPSTRGSWRTFNQYPNRQFGQSGTTPQLCDNCGRSHGFNRCPAFGLTCFGCGKRGHLRARCRSARRGAMSISE